MEMTVPSCPANPAPAERMLALTVDPLLSFALDWYCSVDVIVDRRLVDASSKNSVEVGCLSWEVFFLAWDLILLSWGAMMALQTKSIKSELKKLKASRLR